MAVVELVEEPGLRLTSTVIDCPREEIRGGMALEVVFQEVVPGLTLPVFRPTSGATS